MQPGKKHAEGESQENGASDTKSDEALAGAYRSHFNSKGKRSIKKRGRHRKYMVQSKYLSRMCAMRTSIDKKGRTILDQSVRSFIADLGGRVADVFADSPHTTIKAYHIVNLAKQYYGIDLMMEAPPSHRKQKTVKSDEEQRD